MKKDEDGYVCSMPHCKRGSIIIYYGKPICHGHWDKHCDGTQDIGKTLNIKKSLEDRKVSV